MRRKRIFFFIPAVVLLGLLVWSLMLYKDYKSQIQLELGIFAGSNWEVPNWQSYRVFDEAIAEFERLHPGVKIKYRSGTQKTDYSEWFSQKIVKGTEPDVFCVLSGDFNTFASIGVMKNLDTLIKDDSGFDIGKMYVNAVKSGQFQGSQYALPIEVVPVLMFVNKTLLSKENIQLPKGSWTWEDFYNICRSATKDTNGDGIIDQFGVYGFNWQHAVYTNGQKLFDANGNKASFNSQGVMDSVRFTVKLNSLNHNVRVTSDDFDSGKVAFRPFPFSTYRAYKPYPYRVKKYSGFEWECINLPRGPNGDNASELYSFLFGISSKARHEKEAWEFLKFLTSDKNNQMNVFRYSHGVPVVREVTESEEGRQEMLKYNPDEENIVDMKLLSQVIEKSTVTPRFQKYEEAMNMADKEIFQVINGEKNVESALSYIDREINKFLKQ